MLPQLIANSLIAGSIIILAAIGFGLIYGTARFFHFAQAATITAGAYLTLLGQELFSLPVPLAAVLAVALCGLLGVAMDVCCFRPLRHRHASPLISLLASLGLYIVIQNVISLSFGDNQEVIVAGSGEIPASLLGARLLPVQMAIMATSLTLLLGVAALLRGTRIGKACRAVACDPVLSRTCGVDPDRTLLVVFAIGSALGGAAGVLIALDVGMTPQMGLSVLLLGVVAVIVGGVGSFPGIILGGLLLGFTQHFATWVLGAQWQESIAFGVLLLFLVWRPQGWLGQQLETTTG